MKKIFFLVKTYNYDKLHKRRTKTNRRKRGIKNYQNMSGKKLLRNLDKSGPNFKNISQNGLEQIAKVQNLSQNEPDQIIRMKNLPQNEFEKIAKIRRIKNYKKMSKEGLLIPLLKSEHRPAELYKNESNNAEIEETKKKKLMH